MTQAPDPIDVLTFIAGYSEMRGDEWRARFPIWAARVDKAVARFNRETRGGLYSYSEENPTITSISRAVHHWIFLPLIHEVLDTHAFNQPDALPSAFMQIGTNGIP